MERLDIRDGKEIARFFAYLKHELQVVRVTEQSSVWTSGYEGALDKAMMLYEQEGEFDELVQLMHICLDTSFSVVQSPVFWEWGKYIEELLNDIAKLPINYWQGNVQNDLYMLYSIELSIISELIEADHFAELIHISNNEFLQELTKNPLTPPPIRVLKDGTMLWTLGQTVCYKASLNYARTGEWLPSVLDRRQQTFILYPVTDPLESEESEVWYEFDNNAYDLLRNNFYIQRSAAEHSDIIRHLEKKVRIIPELYFPYACQLLKEGQLEEALSAFLKIDAWCKASIPTNFKGKLPDGNQDMYHFSQCYLSYFSYLKGDQTAALRYLEELQPYLTLDYMDNSDGIEILHHQPENFKRWFQVNYMTNYEDLTHTDKEWLSEPKIREIDLSIPGQIQIDSNYNRQCEFQVPHEIRNEIRPERIVFAAIVATLVTLDPFAVKNDPERQWRGLGRQEGGLIFKGAAITFQSNGVRVKTSEIPLENQNLIYPLLTAQMINRVCDYYVAAQGNTVREKLIHAASQCLFMSNKRTILDEIERSTRERYIDSWNGFFDSH
ncbi:hypothetical protein [Paenibacillus ihuae]|uniref:hypothetical protein n=1 Tax=Paenibacillus ihuae TaxID=1232431 RepID=UPI001AE0757A|nr:hypothetical protein [Paenibacillus ihuae]